MGSLLISRASICSRIAASASGDSTGVGVTSGTGTACEGLCCERGSAPGQTITRLDGAAHAASARLCVPPFEVSRSRTTPDRP